VFFLLVVRERRCVRELNSPVTVCFKMSASIKHTDSMPLLLLLLPRARAIVPPHTHTPQGVWAEVYGLPLGLAADAAAAAGDGGSDAAGGSEEQQQQ
jgi:hypothetical protein